MSSAQSAIRNPQSAIQPGLPMELPEPDSVPPLAWSGGTHDGSRIPESEKLIMRELYTQMGSVHAVVKKTGHTWKVVRAICCPELAYRQLEASEMDTVRTLAATGAKYGQIIAETGLPRSTIAAILARSPLSVEQVQKTRAARLMIEEDMLLEERSEALEKKRTDGKLSVADITNAIMVNGILIKDAGGNAPQRVRHEADPSLLLAAQLFAGAIKPKAPMGPIQEAEVVEPMTNDECPMTK